MSELENIKTYLRRRTKRKQQKQKQTSQPPNDILEPPTRQISDYYKHATYHVICDVLVISTQSDQR